MAFAAWNTARTGVARLRAALVLIVVAAMLLSAFPGHAAHEIAESLTTHATIADPDSGDDGTDAMLDCAVHPGCHAVTLPPVAVMPVPVTLAQPHPARATNGPGILAPPLPQPPNFF